MSKKALQMVVIAPDQMLEAFSVLIQSASSLTLMAAATTINSLRAIIADRIPDLILIYLAEDSEPDHATAALEKIAEIKSVWTEVPLIAILRYAAQLEAVLRIGADLALIEGVSAEKLLAAIEGITI